MLKWALCSSQCLVAGSCYHQTIHRLMRPVTVESRTDLKSFKIFCPTDSRHSLLSLDPPGAQVGRPQQPELRVCLCPSLAFTAHTHGHHIWPERRQPLWVFQRSSTPFNNYSQLKWTGLTNTLWKKTGRHSTNNHIVIHSSSIPAYFYSGSRGGLIDLFVFQNGF